MRILKALAAAAIALSLLPAIPAASGNERRAGSTRTLPALTGVKTDALTRALASGELSEAEYALERAKSLFRLKSVRDRFGAVARPSGRDATLLLRDLALRVRDLSGDDRTAAEALLARPDDPQGEYYGEPYKEDAVITKVCSATRDLCLHYVAAGDGDNFNDVTPAFAASTLTELEVVWDKELTELDFRQPRGDISSDNNGGDDRTDVYLANIGEDGVYGYCNTDDPEIYRFNGRHNVSAYCVLDNDYSSVEFPNPDLTPLQNMQVTAAHEFFHAVQFAYDAYDDSWFLEGTAAWMEDEVYDEVNDNYQYLYSSPARKPGTSLDFTNNSNGFMYRYGAFYFWRYLSERFSDTPQQSDPSLIRRMWEWSDAAGTAPDQYSLQAASTVVGEEGTNMRQVYGDFAATAFIPETFFEEGQDYLDWLKAPSPGGGNWNAADGGRPKLSLNKALGVDSGAGSKTVELDHLSSAYLGFTHVPGTGDSFSLKLKVNGPDKSHGTTATAIVLNDDTTFEMTTLSLNKDGNGTLVVPFAESTVSRVILVASNASTKFACDKGTYYSCSGKPRYDDQEFFVKGSLI
jgi:hypothetical protein